MPCHCCKSVNHTPLTCQFRKSLYCYVCAAYGHSPKKCPNQKALARRRGQDASKVENRELVVLHTEEAIKLYLIQAGLTPLASLEENKALLVDFAYSLPEPKMVIYSR